MRSETSNSTPKAPAASEEFEVVLLTQPDPRAEERWATLIQLLLEAGRKTQ